MFTTIIVYISPNSVQQLVQVSVVLAAALIRNIPLEILARFMESLNCRHGCSADIELWGHANSMTLWSAPRQCTADAES